MNAVCRLKAKKDDWCEDLGLTHFEEQIEVKRSAKRDLSREA